MNRRLVLFSLSCLAQLDESVRTDLAYWSKVIRGAGITAH